jgi:hypothetical protein
MKEKQKELNIGFEFIKVYGFNAGQFEKVLKAHQETGKFPDPATLQEPP